MEEDLHSVPEDTHRGVEEVEVSTGSDPSEVTTGRLCCPITWAERDTCEAS